MITHNLKIKNTVLFVLAICLFQTFFAQQTIDSKPFEAALVPKDAYVFYVIGDWGRQGKYFQKDVAAAMDKCAGKVKPSFIASTGDNFYTFGIKNTNDKLWKKSFEDIYTGNNIKDVDWYVVLGNHDHYGNEQAQIDYSKKNNRWKMPAEYFAYSTPIGNSQKADFLFINTEPLANNCTGSAAQKQWKWIDSSLSHSTAQWKFVFGHHPVYSSNPSHGDTKTLIHHLKPMLEKYHVPAYFCGHDHDLQHQQPAGSSVDYFVSGAGSKLRPTGKYEHTKFAESKAGFAVVALSGNKMMVWFVDKDANVLYSYEK